MEYEGKLIRVQGDEVTFKLDRDFDLAEAHRLSLSGFPRAVRVAIQNNPPSVRVTDESKLIGYLVEQPKKLDKKAIMTDLKAGREVSGAELQHSRSQALDNKVFYCILK